MTIKNTATYKEITTQTEAWAEAVTVVSGQADALKQLWAQKKYSTVIFTGCGSTYYLSLAAASLLPPPRKVEASRDDRVLSSFETTTSAPPPACR